MAEFVENQSINVIFIVLYGVYIYGGGIVELGVGSSNKY